MAPQELTPRQEAIASQRSKLTGQTHDYLRRGRAFANYSDYQLAEQWASVLRQWKSVQDAESLKKMDDLAAEMRLRSLRPPYETL